MKPSSQQCPSLCDRRDALSFRTPDFSKVEPKVYFPKGGYQPPKSRWSASSVGLSPEPTLVFKSPADIAKEVLFSSTDAPAAPPPSPSAPQQNLTVSIVPEDFRCPQRATRLVEQLQVSGSGGSGGGLANV